MKKEELKRAAELFLDYYTSVAYEFGENDKDRDEVEDLVSKMKELADTLGE